MNRFARFAALSSARIIDQALWSFGFFSLNLAAGVVMGLQTFATFSVATAIGLVGVGVARSIGVDAAVISGSRRGVPLSSALSFKRLYLVAATIGTAAFLTASVSTMTTSSAPWPFVFGGVACLLLLVDAPRYFLIYVRRFKSSLILSAAYAAMNGLLMGVALVGKLDWSGLVWLWLVGAAGVSIFGLWMVRNARLESPLSGLRPEWRFAIGMGAEALYVGIAGQIALFILYALGGYNETAGVRLAYSLVLAPVFMLIQGLTPLLMLRFFSDSRHRRDRQVALAVWLGAVAFALAVVVAGAFWVYSLGFADSLIEPTLPFLIPLALSLLASQIFEAGAMSWRLSKRPRVMHNLRLAIVTGDIVAQASGIYFGGADGLISAFIFIALVKSLIGLGMVATGKSRPSDSTTIRADH